MRIVIALWILEHVYDFISEFVGLSKFMRFSPGNEYNSGFS
jgi:hypothetical protein